MFFFQDLFCPSNRAPLAGKSRQTMGLMDADVVVVQKSTGKDSSTTHCFAWAAAEVHDVCFSAASHLAARDNV